MRDGREWGEKLRCEIQKAVVGQDAVIERLQVALLANGHVLLEGLPGLAKTLLVRCFAQATGLHFERIQFTPDLLPSDLIGTMIFRPQDGRFEVHRGPIFANLVLADEVNRAPAKVQSGLLEAMQERQVTIGADSLRLPDPFFVMATQNPLEQEGTYPLPEAQSDRFLFKLLVDYPSEAEEQGMLARWGRVTETPTLESVTSAEELLALRAEVDAVHASDELQRYILALVRATREAARPDTRNDASRDARPESAAARLSFGASPRASLALLQASRALAWLRGRDFVTPDLVQELVPDALRHRVGLSFEAEALGITTDAVLHTLVEKTAVPVG